MDLEENRKLADEAEIDRKMQTLVEQGYKFKKINEEWYYPAYDPVLLETKYQKVALEIYKNV